MPEKHRVFIAEDESIIAMSFEMIIKNMNHEVVGKAMDGQAAVEGIRATKPDLIIMDINMPRLDGISVLQEINQGTITPCIIVTSYFDDKLIERANQAGAFSYLIKPVDRAQLEAAVHIVSKRFAEFKALAQETESLKTALENRKYVEKAKGILMTKLSMSEEDAMRQMQKMSRNKNKKMIDIAKGIISAERAMDF